MDKIMLVLFTAAILFLAGTAQAMRERRPSLPPVCVAPEAAGSIVFEGRGLAFMPGRGVEPVIVRRIAAPPCGTS